MSAIPFHCPHCLGLFQVDDSLAGLQIDCPHCQRPVTLPEIAATAAPPQGASLELSCPLCAGPFQVPPEYAGQQVHCPHCQAVVSVPDLAGMNFGSAAPPLPATVPAPPPAINTIPPGKSKPPPGRQSQVAHADLYPPGYRPPESTASGPAIGPKSPSREESAQRAARRSPSEAQRPEPVGRSSSSAVAPPASRPLLPPDTGLPAIKPQRPADLLPPGAAETTDMVGQVQRKPLPVPIPSRCQEEILIPTEQGYIGVHEPVRTVQRHGEAVVLRKLTAEEKARRRLLRNALLFALCILTLIVVMALFMRK